MTEEQRVRACLLAWARAYWQDETTGAIPQVELVSLVEVSHEQDEWEAELLVSSSADNPTVSFFLDADRLHVQTIEY